MSDEDDFNWSDSHNLVVVELQAPIAVYTNSDGEITIRQDGHSFCQYDSLIVVRPKNAQRLADAILALAETVPAPAALALPAPADRTAADRQRRHRERKRNGEAVTVTPVTPCATKGADLFPD